jgi:hypothetical protein
MLCNRRSAPRNGRTIHEIIGSRITSSFLQPLGGSAPVTLCRPREASMQGLAVISAVLLTGFGLAMDGWRGGLTGLVVAVGIGSGLAIWRAESDTWIASAGSVRAAQRWRRNCGNGSTCRISLRWMHSGWLAVPGMRWYRGWRPSPEVARRPLEQQQFGVEVPDVQQTAVRIHRSGPASYL